MRFSDVALPVRMSRVAIVAPRVGLRDALVAVAESGTMEIVGALPAPAGEEAEALRRLERAAPGGKPVLPRILRAPEETASLEQAGACELLAGEVELRRRAALGLEHGSFSVLVGWTPTEDLPELERSLDAVGAGTVELPLPPYADPPTLMAETRVKRPFSPLMTTYGVAPYADLDVTVFAGIAFVLMFAIMFGDVGHGLLLALVGLMLSRVRRGRLAPFRPVWPLLVISGVAAAFVGLLYGEAFGPTELVPRLWLDPVEDPIPLLVAALVIGVALLVVSHAYAIVNRAREGGARAALLSPSGVAGLCVLLGASCALVGALTGIDVLLGAGVVLLVVGAALLGVGFLAAARAEGGFGAALALTTVELVDALVRTASNVLSFARLAAFGVLHSALGLAVLAGAGALWGGIVGSLLGVAVFVIGNLAAFSLELLVTGIQALRLEFYELFSRIFAGQGHPYSPWRVPVVTRSEEP